jgi:hypothetical protein
VPGAKAGRCTCVALSITMDAYSIIRFQSAL